MTMEKSTYRGGLGPQKAPEHEVAKVCLVPFLIGVYRITGTKNKQLLRNTTSTASCWTET